MGAELIGPRPAGTLRAEQEHVGSASVDVARRVAAELAPLARRLDQDPAALADSYAILRRHGYLALPVPTELGGGGATMTEVLRSQRVVAAACSNTALAVNMHLFQVGALADRWRHDGVGDDLLRSVADRGVVLASTTGEAIGLDPFTTSTTARRTSAGYRIDGRKFFCSQARVMDLVRVLATDVDTGELVLVIVPADSDGLTIVEPPLTMGMRGTQSFDLVLDNVVVDESAVVLRLSGQVPLAEPAIAAGAVWFLFSLAAVYAGVADGARCEAARLRRSGRPGAGRIELLRHRIDALLEFGLARHAKRPDLDASLRLAVATKEDVITAACELIDQCVAVTGAVGFTTASTLEQSVRDVRAGRHHPPTPTTTMRLLESDGSPSGRADDGPPSPCET